MIIFSEVKMTEAGGKYRLEMSVNANGKKNRVRTPSSDDIFDADERRKFEVMAKDVLSFWAEKAQNAAT